ncbi:copper radical oxidase [Dichomitus squalens]|uniref:Copper radical oxidase n=1 Tax=Dichomitus squalens TaxID=114155 RepID=A0A4Q9NVM1_9APHY|nr:copper radical oxidase [Dichomitus squalens]TBU45794.1 copper radical oxidase [Dichomitus squalens]TBU61728.1 copper radical oxidase [Dichomitus squalens]
MNVRAAAAAISLFASAYAQTISPPGQPSTSDAPLGQFKIVGNSIASAQQLFLGTLDKVYIVDKVENNPAKINGHPAWASEYSISKNSGRPMDIVTNTFCAGGTVLGNGTWLNVGGNQAVTTGGVAASSQNGGGVYDDPDGGKSLINPCDDSSCEWTLTADMSTRRWYPTLETLDDGSAIVLGGCLWGGYVNDASQDNPTWEIFPPTGDGPIHSDILANTLPANLYPLTWILPSGKLLVQSNWKTVLLDYKKKQETPLDDMLDAVRVYPASGGTAMLPLTPDNNYTATILFCGGSNLQPDQWKTNWDIAQFNASTSCVRLTPDQSSSYVEDDALPEGRSMGNLILLPNGKILMLNGAQTGTAGYGTENWAINESYADNPVLMPIMYDPSAPQGKRWSRDGLSPSTIPRMYHSSATLLPDGSVFVSGSNPHADYAVDNVKFPTEYRVEYFYPSYYNQRRPEPKGILSSLSYGGSYFNVTLTKDDLFGDVNNIKNTQVIVLRTGFSTHTMNMGQRMLQLGSTYTGDSEGSTTLHVNQMPPNPATFPPGPALVFVVVNGVPSVGVQVMVGNGKIGKQPTADVATLPTSAITSTGSSNSSSDGSGDNVAQSHHKSDADGLHGSMSSFAAVVVTGLVSWTMLASLL